MLLSATAYELVFEAMMLANTMMPEAYEHAGKLAGVATVVGFALAVWMVVLEHAGAG